MEPCFCIGQNGIGKVALQWYRRLPTALSICNGDVNIILGQLGIITNSDLNRPCFAWHPYGKSGLFKTELVIVKDNTDVHVIFCTCVTFTS